jgi:hypothetical protein
MSLPGFTAEDSLSKSNEHYKLVTDNARNLKSWEIIPQGWWEGGCYYTYNSRTGRWRLRYCMA